MTQLKQKSLENHQLTDKINIFTAGNLKILPNLMALMFNIWKNLPKLTIFTNLKINGNLKSAWLYASRESMSNQIQTFLDAICDRVCEGALVETEAVLVTAMKTILLF